MAELAPSGSPDKELVDLAINSERTLEMKGCSPECVTSVAGHVDRLPLSHQTISASIAILYLRHYTLHQLLTCWQG